ncbi:hypothetical protein MMC29_004839 [Sticta canariensis]|nr:hypothetical protein [Sticta canariensis]
MLIVLTFSASLSSDQWSSKGITDKQTLENLVATYQLPGLAVGVSRNGNFTDEVTGVRKVGDPAPILSTDQFHLGSNTKAMTATLLALLVEEGILNWTTTLKVALPALARNMSPAHEETTLEMLTAHRSGIVDDPITYTTLLPDLYSPSTSPEQARWLLVNRFLSEPPANQTGVFNYGNINYVIVGSILERVTSTAWETLMQTRIFSPLKMNCGFGITPESSNVSVENPWPHVPSAQGPVPFTVEMGHQDLPPALGPAGTVHCPPADYAHFLQLHLDGENGSAKSLNLSTQSFKHLHTPYPGPGPYQYAYGGWVCGNLLDTDDGLVLSHDGSNFFNWAYVMLVPRTNTAYMALTNVGGDSAGKATGVAIRDIKDGKLLKG